MRVQLSEKSKAEFIELINKDSITCWFEGDEFVMPSGQGKTAKGIVLGKLLVWQHQQSKVDELQKRVDAVKGLTQTLWEKSKEKHQQGKVWESKTLGECADEILDVLEQALKGDQ